MKVKKCVYLDELGIKEDNYFGNYCHNLKQCQIFTEIILIMYRVKKHIVAELSAKNVGKKRYQNF